MVRTIGYTWWYWSGNPSVNVKYFIIVLWLHCFILQVVMVRINWIHMVCWSGNSSFHVMLFCFHIVLLLIFVLSLHCFILKVVMVRINWMHMIRWSGDLSFNVMLLCFHVLFFAVLSLHYFILQVVMVRINWIHMICGSGDPSFNVMLCFVLIVYHFIVLFYKLSWWGSIGCTWCWSGDPSLCCVLLF